MPAESPTQGLPFSEFALVLLVLGALAYEQVPFRGTRPVDPDLPPVADRKTHEVEARLWEDPFSAVARHKRNTQDEVELSNKGTASRTIGVIVLGEPYSADADWRRNMRYAALSALSVEGYVPDDDRHIRYAIWKLNGKNSKPEERVDVPYDTLVGKAGDEVVVLWLREDYFEEESLCRLLQLRKTVDTKDSRYPLVVLGPSSSTAIRKLVLSDRDKCGAATEVKDWKPFALLSFAATASAEDLLEKRNPEERDLARRFESYGARFARTIPRDDELLDSLIEELGRRRVDANACEIALVGEWDTVYARSLADRFQKRARGGKRADGACLRVFGYLRGLDGQLPADQATASEKREGDGDREDRGAGHIQRPSGRGQYDYMRRLADRIEAARPRIRAIGVVGSDVYDKLVVLQALRPRFPDAVFFTTDLDANLLHPDELESTRNLVVASGFGLELAPALQEGIPPFRTIYQTSLFLAVRLAVRDLANEASWKEVEASLRSCLGPRIFEIGRSKPWDLTVKDPDCGNLLALLSATAGGDAPSSGSLHPAREALAFGALGLWVVVGALLFGLGMLLSEGLRRMALGGFEWGRRHLWGSAAAGVLLLALGLWIWFALRDATGEPFSLTEGLSIWPSLFLRLAAAGLAVAFLVRGWDRLARNRRELAHDFFPKEPPEAEVTLRQWWRQVWAQAREAGPGRAGPVRSLWRAVVTGEPSPLAPSQDDQGKPVKAVEVWRSYTRLAALGPSMLRIGASFLLFYGAGRLVVWHMGEPASPARGSAQALELLVLLGLGVPLLLVFLFAAGDGARLCRNLIDRLGAGPTEWPENDLCRAPGARARKLPPDWLDVQFILRRSEAVEGLVTAPFVILLLMLLSRWNYFDAFRTPASLWIVIGGSAAYALHSAFQLHRAAEGARRAACDRLTLELLSLKGSGQGAERVAELELALEDVRGNRRGAFLSPLQRPLMRTSLLVVAAVAFALFQGKGP